MSWLAENKQTLGAHHQVEDPGLRDPRPRQRIPISDRETGSCTHARGGESIGSLLQRLLGHCQAVHDRLLSPDTVGALLIPKEPRDQLQVRPGTAIKKSWGGPCPSAHLAWLPATRASCAPSSPKQSVGTRCQCLPLAKGFNQHSRGRSPGPRGPWTRRVHLL